MPYSDIKNLRNAGQYAEALELAQNEYNAKPDIWEARALFICLYDRIKTEDATAAATTYQQMKELFEQHNLDDEINRGMLNRAQQKTDPIRIDIQKARDMAKNEKKGEEAYRIVSKYYDNGSLPDDEKRTYGWIIYYALSQDTNISAHTFERKRRLMRYFNLELEKPSLLHSLILSEAVRLEKEADRDFVFQNFFKLWGGCANFRKEDWEQYKTEQKTIPSLVEKVITVYVKEIETDNRQPSEDFIELIDNALERFNNNQNLPRQRAILYIHSGEKDKAVDLYKRILRKNASRYYLWSELAELTDSGEQALAFVCQAIYQQHDESFIGKVRLRLAELLCEDGDYSHAAGQLELVKTNYEKQGWHLPAQYNTIAARIPNGTEADTSRKFITDLAANAPLYIYDDINEAVLVKTGEKALDNRKQWFATDGQGKSYRLNPVKLKLPKRCADGTAIEVRTAGNNVISAKISDVTPSFVRKVSGTIKRRVNSNGAPFAFVDNVYIGKQLLAPNIADGSAVEVLAIEQDGKWRALRIKQL